jgi:hypothetical protein
MRLRTLINLQDPPCAIPLSFLPRDRTTSVQNCVLRTVLREYSITMLRSTISTGSYILQKYSRSYPSNTSSQTQSQDQVADWQHFTNPPVLTLTLDVKKSADNELFESVRLRIIWNLDEGGQREIIMVRTEQKWAHICAFRLKVCVYSSGRPGSVGVLRSRLLGPLFARIASQSRPSRLRRRNPIPASS